MQRHKASFKNKSVSKTETAVSLVILGALLAVAGGIFVAQYQTNPALQVSNAPLPLSQSPGAVPAEGSSEPSRLPLPEGLIPLTPPETFDAQTLSDKIDGKAELYLSAGFQGLRSRRFAVKGDPDLWLELYVYDMGNSQNAFAVFSLQRREGAFPLELTSYSYQTENGVFLVHGRYYAEVIGSGSSSALLDMVRSTAGNFVAHTPADSGGPDGTDLFPQKGLNPESITLLSSDAFGCQGLDQVYTATYRLEGRPVVAFLSRRETQGAAAELADAYYLFLLENGGKAISEPAAVPGARAVDILGGVEVIFSRGLFFAGIHDAEDRALAAAAAAMLNGGLEEGAHGN